MYTNLNLLLFRLFTKHKFNENSLMSLICIYEYLIKGQCLSFHLVPYVLVYVHFSRKYA